MCLEYKPKMSEDKGSTLLKIMGYHTHWTKRAWFKKHCSIRMTKHFIQVLPSFQDIYYECDACGFKTKLNRYCTDDT